MTGPPSKYGVLAQWLSQQTTSTVPLAFAYVEAILGSPLPRTAHLKHQWWLDPKRSALAAQCHTAGWHVSALDLDAQQATFARISWTP